MLQIFFRGKKSISRLVELTESGILASGNNSPSDMAITLYNRIEMLNLQANQLKAKRDFLIANDDLENVITAIENEIAALRNNLQQIVRMSSGDK